MTTTGKAQELDLAKLLVKLYLSFQTDSEERDINDVFENILFSEENLQKEGFDEGFVKGTLEGNVEGFHLGYHRGAEIGAELGYYLGVTESQLLLLQKNEESVKNNKIVKNLNTLKDLIEQFPNCNSEDVDIFGLLDNVRCLFKKVCALLKIDSSYPEADKLTF